MCKVLAWASEKKGLMRLHLPTRLPLPPYMQSMTQMARCQERSTASTGRGAGLLSRTCVTRPLVGVVDIPLTLRCESAGAVGCRSILQATECVGRRSSRTYGGAILAWKWQSWRPVAEVVRKDSGYAGAQTAIAVLQCWAMLPLDALHVSTHRRDGVISATNMQQACGTGRNRDSVMPVGM